MLQDELSTLVWLVISVSTIEKAARVDKLMNLLSVVGKVAHLAESEKLRRETN